MWKTKISPDKNGIIHGEYFFPDNIQPGTYILQIANGSKRIKIEAYKLPKYKINFALHSEEIIPGDTAKITGKIKTYSGMPVNESKIVYSVWRKKPIPLKSFWQFSFYPQKTFIKTDTTIADANGNFSFSFPTIKDTTRTHYQIIVRCILPSGETEEKTT